MSARFTYAVSFTALIATVTAEIIYWPIAKAYAFDGLIIYTVIPTVLIAVNASLIKVCLPELLAVFPLVTA